MIQLIKIKNLYWGKYPVTQKQWIEIMGNNPSYNKGDNDCPVENVSWYEAQEFITKLNASQDEMVYRLPTSSEWESVLGDIPEEILEYAYLWENSDQKTNVIGLKKPNAFGLYDMLGNVWEWCEDSNDEGYKRIRGGSCSSNAYYLRASYRNLNNTTYRSDIIGFRLVAQSTQSSSDSEKPKEEKMFLIYKMNFIDDSKESIITTSDTEEEVIEFINYLEIGNMDRDFSYHYEQIKFVKKLKET